jgi:hypothetical protein
VVHAVPEPLRAIAVPTRDSGPFSQVIVFVRFYLDKKW